MKAPRTNTAALALCAALLLLAPQAPPRAQTRPAPPRPAAGQAPKTQAAPAAPRPTPAPLAGRVVGDAGEPIAGVPVFANSRAPGANMRGPQIAASDDDGAFLFPSLEPGLYFVTASAPGFVTESDPLTGRPANTFRPGDNAVVRLSKGGVVTGSVTDQQGEPLVGLSVRALRVRDLDGRLPPTPFPVSADDRTDDRGVYRIYGLQPGLYVVYTGGLSPSAFAPVTAYGGDAPTFYPSGTRDTAAEVAVRGGQEAAGIDIRHREEQGRRVTGTVEAPPGFAAASGPAGDLFGIGVSLNYAGTPMTAGSGSVNPNSNDRSFSIEGVADGEYEIQAQTGGREGMTASTAPARVSVRGADVTGLRLSLRPLGSAAGSLRVEPMSEADRAREPCKAARPSSQLPQETVVTATPEWPRSAAPRPLTRLDAPRDTTPDETGAFSLRALEPARYRLSFRLFDEALYVGSVQTPGAAPAAATAARAPAAAAAPQSRDVFEVKSGQQVTGIGVRLSEGAASFAGRVALAEGATPQTPAPTRVHLVPQERERADDASRYYETAVGPDGAFSFRNLAPGRYLLLARAEADSPDPRRRPAAWDAPERALLRREAESAATPVELQPCQRTPDFALKFPQSK